MRVIQQDDAENGVSGFYCSRLITVAGTYNNMRIIAGRTGQKVPPYLRYFIESNDHL